MHKFFRPLQPVRLCSHVIKSGFGNQIREVSKSTTGGILVMLARFLWQKSTKNIFDWFQFYLEHCLFPIKVSEELK